MQPSGRLSSNYETLVFGLLSVCGTMDTVHVVLNILVTEKFELLPAVF